MATTTADTALTTVQRFVQAMTDQDIALARSLLHDDFVVYEAGGLPYSGTYHGADGFFNDLYGEIMKLTDLTPLGEMDFLQSGNTVAAYFRLRFTSRATGEKFDTGMVEAYKVHGDKIAELDVFYKDPAGVAAHLVKK